MNNRLLPLWWALMPGLFAAVPPAVADCLSDAQVARLAAAFEAGEPAENPGDLSTVEGECSRAKFNAILRARLGAPAGYKAGLTNGAVQQRFGHDSPVRGTLYAPMLLHSGVTVPSRFGARPLFEADLLVRVSDPAINRATTPAEVLTSIDQVIPFIELPDLIVNDPGQLNGAAIIAINVGARLGVMGGPITVGADSGLAEALQDMTVVVRGNGDELDRGQGSDVLGHPLNAVIWLASDLAREGLALNKGDLVSLGSFSRLLPPAPGLAVEIQYLGLPGDPKVEVFFH
jgi:2-keto-4-pentenoate hydratase